MSEIMNGDEINEIERYIPSGNPDALHRPLRNVVASHRALQAKVRELEGQVADYAEQLETRDAYGQMQAKISDLEAKLRQVEQERDQARADTQSLRDLVGQWIWAMYLTPESYECRTLETYRQAVEARVRQLEELVQAELPPPLRRLEQQELLRLRARVGRLEEALRTVSSVGRNILKPKFDHCGFMNATQLGNRDAVLHMLKQVERALEGKEEYGRHDE